MQSNACTVFGQIVSYNGVRRLPLLLPILLLFFIASCNVYQPLHRRSNPSDYLEAATRCQHQKDHDCAIENLSKLPDGELKTRKLCVAYLARIGFTTRAYLSIISSDGAFLLGNTASRILPWSEAKVQDARLAVETCGSLSGKLGALVKSVALVVDCALRIAKADVWVATSTSDQDCKTPGNSNGVIERTDIIADNTVMCPSDAIACRNDLMEPIFSQLQSAGAEDLKEALDGLPGALKDSSVAVSLLLIAIRSAVSP